MRFFAMDQRRAAALLGLLLAGCQGSDSSRSSRGAKPFVSAPAAAEQTEAREVEPWSELPAAPPGLRWPRARPALQRPPGLRMRPPPPARRPSPALARALAQVARLWRQGRRAAARTLAAGHGGATASSWDLTASAFSPCLGCALDAVRALHDRLRRTGWAWSEARCLLPVLGSPAESVRAAALRAFGEAATRLGARRLQRRLEPHLPVFRQLTLDPSPWVRAEAITLLGLLGDRVAHRRLGDATRDRFPRVRIAAARAIERAIGLVAGAPTTRQVCRLLGDRSPAVRAGALQALRSEPLACGLSPVIGLLADASLAQLRRQTDASGSQGTWRPGWPSVREVALFVLPPLCRLGLPAGAPLDLRIGQAREAARAMVAPGIAAPAPRQWRLNPRRPLPALPLAGLSPAALSRFAASSSLDEVRDPTSGATTQRRPCRPLAQARLALWLPRLPAREIPRALGACDRIQLRGALLVQVLGLLAHRAAAVRLAALAALYRVIDDQRGEVLGRALWLARRDPHPLVRAAALGVLTHWHEGRAVRLRLRWALRDPHPVVQHAAVRPALRLDGDQVAALLVARLGSLHPLVRAEALAFLIPDPLRRPAARVVARYLDDQARAEISIPLGRRRRHVGVGVTVAARILETLETVFGVRHRGAEHRRARRWQDDLLRYGWSLPERSR